MKIVYVQKKIEQNLKAMRCAQFILEMNIMPKAGDRLQLHQNSISFSAKLKHFAAIHYFDR